MTRVLIYGATGYTGTLVAQALVRRGGVEIVLGGRDRDRLRETATAVGDVETRVAEAHETDRLKKIASDANIVVNCAGPFSRFGEPVVRAALDAGAHYLDTTGEQGFMRDIYERYDSAARRAAICIVNSLGFEIALGDWLAGRAAVAIAIDDASPADEVIVGYAMDNFRPTRGTRLSALESLAGPGVVWRKDRWEAVAPAAEQRTIGFPPPFGGRESVSFPSGEVISVVRHIPARYVQSFVTFGGDGLAALLPRAAGVLGGALGNGLASLARSPLARAVRTRIKTGPIGPTTGQRAVDDFAVAVEIKRGFDHSYAAITGTDVYGVTAEVIALGVEQLASATAPATGVCAPSEAFDPIAAVDTIVDRCSLQLHEGA